MREKMIEIDAAIKSWPELKDRRRYTLARERILVKLLNNLTKYTLLQLDILESLRGMGRAVEYELKILRSRR